MAVRTHVSDYAVNNVQKHYAQPMMVTVCKLQVKYLRNAHLRPLCYQAPQ